MSNTWKTIRQAFEIKNNPYPWNKAISAGICLSAPVLIGLLFGSLQNGLYAGIGGFTYLYMFNEPYAQRAKKLFFVMIGLAAAVGLGTVLAPYPYAIAVTAGVIGVVGTFIFGALKIPGPAAIFFILVFTMTSAMEIAPDTAPLRAGLVLLGGVFSWLVAMYGWFINPRGPETGAIKRVYSQLAQLLDSVGTEEFSGARQRTLQQIKAAENTLHAGYISWDKSSEYKKLYRLYDQANAIFSEVLEFHAPGKTRLPEEIGESLRALSASIGLKASKSIQLPEHTGAVTTRLMNEIDEVQEILSGREENENQKMRISKTSVKDVFSGAFHKNSIVFVSAIRYGFILMIAALIAFSFDFDRSYWIPLSCAAVMLGSTVVTTFHRAIQRSVGTVVGILLASVLLSTHPGGYLIVLIIFLLSSLTELFILRNYAIALFFITPNAIFMAENTTQIHDVSYFASTRIIDIFIGCAIGLIGTYLIGRRSASGRIPHLLSKTIRSQMGLIVLLFSEQRSEAEMMDSGEMKKMKTNLNNLGIVYTTALGEIPRNKKALDHLWPVIYSIEHLGYLLEATAAKTERPVLRDEDLSQLLLVFEMMAKAAGEKQLPATRYIPEIKGHPLIQKEIGDLQQALQMNELPGGRSWA